ncbi:MAG: tetratricopeptide repeat protein [Candidatus Lokiarchaeota archaeon]|nr:tetratricopeptide repeat protein [Candidatus Lokiarchaeota archaeon]
MKNIDFDFQKVLASSEMLTFLAGAGISVDAPSCLPSATHITGDIIQFCCPEEVSQDILSENFVKKIRFEFILQLFRDELDPNLKIMEYYAQAKKPNTMHRFLADMIRKGHIVMTTNFDYLIEYALGRDNPNATAIITANDFLSYKDPIKLAESAVHPIYKLHGSQENIFTGENTIDSVITTLDAFVREKEENVFSLPLYERDMFNNACKGRTLVVMGYSGGDVFDIIPALMQTTSLKRIIWIEHIGNMDNKTNIYRIKSTNNKPNSDLDELLSQLHRSTGVEIIKIQGKTSAICSSAIEREKDLKDENLTNRTEEPIKWLQDHFPQLEEVERQHIAGRIYSNYGQPKKALQYFQKAYELFEKSHNIRGMANELMNFGRLHGEIGEPQKALKYYKRAYLMLENTKHIEDRVKIVGNMGIIYMDIGDSKKALEHYNRAYKMNKKLNNRHGIANNLGNMGWVYRNTGEPEMALEKYQSAYKIHKELNNLQAMAIDIGNIGMIYMDMGKKKEALDYCQQSYDIHKEINDLQGIATDLSYFGMIYIHAGQLHTALEYYQKAYKIHKQINNLREMASDLGNIGLILIDSGKLKQALQYIEKAYEINKDLHNLLGISANLANMGLVYLTSGDLNKALECYQKAFKISQELNNLKDIATILGNLVTIYTSKEEPEKALEYSKQGYKIYEKLNNLIGMARNLTDRGILYMNMGNTEKALEISRKSHTLYEKINDLEGMAKQLNNMGFIYSQTGDNQNALRFYRKTHEIYKKLNKVKEVGDVLDNMGTIYGVIGNNEKSLEYHQNAYSIYEQLNDVNEMAIILESIGVEYLNLKHWNKAEECFLKIHSLNPDNTSYAYNLACLFSKKRQKNTMLDWLKTAISLNNEYKQLAARDKDFIDYWNDSDFQSLVGSQ